MSILKRIRMGTFLHSYFVVVQSLSCVWLFVTPWTAARQASLSITNSRIWFKPMSTESVMPSNHLILCRSFSCLQTFPSSGSFPMSQFFTSGAQSIGASASASVLPMYQVLFYSKYLHCRNCSWKQFYAGFIIWAIFLLLARLSTI